MRRVLVLILCGYSFGCGMLPMGKNPTGGLNDSRFDNRSRRIELATSLIGYDKNAVIQAFGNPNPSNMNMDGDKFPRVKGDPYEDWITSEEEWFYHYYEHGVPLINSVNYWISFHFIDDRVVTVDY